MIENTKPLSDILTEEYTIEELAGFFGAASSNESVLSELAVSDVRIAAANEKYPIECLRKTESGVLYTVYKVRDGGLYYVFWTDILDNTVDAKEETIDLAVYFTAYLPSSITLTQNDFNSIVPSTSTAADVASIDPNFELCFLLSSRIPSYSLLEDGSVMEICYDFHDKLESRADLIVTSKEVISGGGTFSRLAAVYHYDLPTDPPLSNSLIANGGPYAGDGSFIYFSNSAKDNALYRMTTELTGYTLLDDTKCHTLFLDETHIYYNSWNRNAELRTSPYPSLCKIRLDGTDRVELAEKATIVGLTDESVFFLTDDHQLKRIHKDGSNEALLLADTAHNSYFQITSDYIFFSNLSDEDEHGLYRLGTDSGEQVKLTDDYASWTNISGGEIYYVDGNGDLVVMDFDGNNRKVIAEGDFGRITVDGEWVFYVDYDAEPDSLCKIKCDGTEKTVLYSDKNVIAVSKIGDIVFFTAHTPGTDDNTEYCIRADGTTPFILPEE